MRPVLLLICWLLLPYVANAQSQVLDQAQAHWFAGRQPQAVALLEQALLSEPQTARWRFVLAWMLQERGELDRAEDMLRRLIEDFPDMAEAHNNLAALLASRGDLDAALQLLQRAVLLQPLSAQAQENLGDVLLRLAQRAYGKAADAAAPRTALSLKLKRLNDSLLTPAP